MLDYKILKPGDKLEFKGSRPIWFANVLKNAGKLVVGQEYTIRSVEPASSWCCIKLEEFPETEVFGDDWFSLSFFTRKNEDIQKT